MLLGTLCDEIHGHDPDHEGRPAHRVRRRAAGPGARADTRWEWHALDALRRLPQPLFTASAHALNTMWPGLLPGLPARALHPQARTGR